ncbi:MAG: DM13 domain-containing protein [Hyphomicrobium sp.]
MRKWSVMAGSVLAVVAVIVLLCFRIIGLAHAEPGVLQGAGGHKASGHVEIVREGTAIKLVLKDDFTLQDAPAPRLAWGKDGYKRGTIFATLAKFKGTQEYAVPAGTDLGQFNELWIWCEKFDVPLAVAKLK